MVSWVSTFGFTFLDFRPVGTLCHEANVLHCWVRLPSASWVFLFNKEKYPKIIQRSHDERRSISCGDDDSMKELVTLSWNTWPFAKLNMKIAVFCFCYFILGASLVAQWWRIHLSVQAMRFPSLSWEDPLEKAMATRSNVLAWEIPWTVESGELQTMGSQKSQTWLGN